MKYCIVVPDGAADYPVKALGDKTPLDAAQTPHMDRAAREGLLGLACHVPPRMTPGSDVAMMSLVGYDPVQHYTGRAPLEAADLGLDLGPYDWAVRCNLVTTSDDTLLDFTAGHISTDEASHLIQALNDELSTDQWSFHVGTSYRHILMARGMPGLPMATMPPHDIVGQALLANYPRGEHAELLTHLMDQSREILARHPVNRARVKAGKRPATMIWLWGQGKRPTLTEFRSRFGLRGAAISAVNLVRGIGRLIGWDVILVPGATGYLDTDYAAKGRYGIEALQSHDIVLVHVEAPDEASHDRNPRAKLAALERIDADIVGPLMDSPALGGDLRLLIVPDHVTSVEDGLHKRDWVPFAMWGAGVKAASGCPYTEAHARSCEIEIEHGHDLMSEFLGKVG